MTLNLKPTTTLTLLHSLGNQELWATTERRLLSTQTTYELLRGGRPYLQTTDPVEAIRTYESCAMGEVYNGLGVF